MLVRNVWKKEFYKIKTRRHSLTFFFNLHQLELIVNVELRLATGYAVVGDVSEGEDVGAKVVLEDNDLVVSLLEERSRDVERFLRPRDVVTTDVKTIDKDGSVLPVLRYHQS